MAHEELRKGFKACAQRHVVLGLLYPSSHLSVFGKSTAVAYAGKRVGRMIRRRWCIQNSDLEAYVQM
eukprot:6475059-Amphidinium_carterae.1